MPAPSRPAAEKKGRVAAHGPGSEEAAVNPLEVTYAVDLRGEEGGYEDIG